MTTFRRYMVTDYSDGFQVKNRPHPLDVESAPEWLVEFVYEHSRLKREPIWVSRQPYSLQMETAHEKKLFSYVDYYGLVQSMAESFMNKWSPPEKIEDEHVDKGPPEMRGWGHPKVHEWVFKQTASSVNKMIHTSWQRLRNEADPTVVTVQKRVFSAAYDYGRLHLVQQPVFFRHPYIVKDVMNYRAAAVAAGLCGRLAIGEKGIADAMEYMGDWKGFFSPDLKSYRALNVTLMHLPGGIPAKLLLNLIGFFLPRPITCRLELLVTILAHKHTVNNLRVFCFAQKEQIAEAIRRVSAHLRSPCSLRRWRDISTAIRFIGDYPDDHRGNIVGLAEKSIRWHRDRRQEATDRTLASFGPEKELKKPPIPLPSFAGVRFLATVGDLCQEGIEMKHCIATYARKGVMGYAYFFHIERGVECASVEVDWLGNVLQANGPHNTMNGAVKWGRDVLSQWGQGLRCRQGTDTRPGVHSFRP